MLIDIVACSFIQLCCLCVVSLVLKYDFALVHLIKQEFDIHEEVGQTMPHKTAVQVMLAWFGPAPAGSASPQKLANVI